MAWPLLVMMAAGSALKMGAGMYGASQAVKQGKYQQDILDYESKYLDAAKKIEEEKIRSDVKKVIGVQRAATAASGFSNDIGTPLELEISSEIQGDIDIALLRQAGSIEQLRLNTAGRMARAESHGIAAGMYANVTATGVNTLLSQGARHGWFKGK